MTRPGLVGAARRLAVAGWLAGYGIQPALAQSAADRRSAEEVRTLFERFNRAWERRDSAFIREFYAPDSSGIFFFERRQLRGWPRVDSLYRAMFASAGRGTVRSGFEILDVGARGDVAWLAANFRLEVIGPAGDTTVDEGRQTLVLERRQGKWRVIHRHTSFQAPPGPQRRVPLHTGPGPLWSPADDPTSGPDAREIHRLRAESNDAIARHDTAGIGAALRAGATIVTSTSTVYAGRAPYLRGFAEQFARRPDLLYRRTAEEIRVEPVWQVASERGRWFGRWTDGDGPVTIEGSYFARWRRFDGKWAVESETYVPERCTGGAYCRAPP